MDQTPFDPTSADASYEGQPSVGYPPDAAERAVAPQSHETFAPDERTPSGDDAPPADWRDRLGRAEQEAQEAKRRAAEFDRMMAYGKQQYELQQAQDLDRRFETFQHQLDDLTPEQIRQGNAQFRAEFKAREQRWQQQYQQVEQRTLLTDWQEHLAQEFGLDDASRRRLSQRGFANPDEYRDYAEELADRQRRDAEIAELRRAVDRDREAEAHIADGRHRVGGSGRGPVLGRDDFDPTAPDYDSRATLANILFGS